MQLTVFFSWQSDTPASRGRSLIERALGRAVATVAGDTAIPYRPTLDQGTEGVPGAPAMVAAILEKIDACSVFVGDVSLTFERDSSNRKSPNPNVLIELGYALRRLGAERVLLVVDTNTGRPEQLPFDLRGNRVITYDGAAEDDEALEKDLSKQLEVGLRLILEKVGPPHDIAPRVHIDLQFNKEQLENARHEYRLRVEVVNSGTSILKDWAVELRFPRKILNPSRSYPIVGKTAEDGRVTMRQSEANHSGPIFPGERKEVLAIDYIMTHELYEQRAKLFPQKVEAFFYVEGELVVSAHRTVKDLQVF